MKNKLSALLFFTLGWFCLMFLTGTINSGFHFQDDHEIIYINSLLNDIGFQDTLSFIVQNDLKIRFRPFYFVVRVIMTELYGLNFLLWSIHNMILAALTSFFLFLFAYEQKYNLTTSIIFSLIVLIGVQSTIWWRIGPAETLAIFLLSISLSFLVKAINREKRILMVSSVLLIFLATLTKESFILFIPAYILFFIYLSYKKLNEWNLKRFLILNLWLFFSLGIIMLCELVIIYFVIGTSKVEYAGIDNSFRLSELIIDIVKFFKNENYTYLILIGSFLLLQTVKNWKLSAFLSYKNNSAHYFVFIIFLSILIPQLIIYNKSGIFERYYIPLSLGFSFTIIFLIQRIYENKVITNFTKRAYLFAVFIILFLVFKNDAMPAAKSFAHEGVITNKMLQKLESQTSSQDSILIVLNGYINYEMGYSIDRYLKLKLKRKNVYYYNDYMKFDRPWANSLQTRFANDENLDGINKLGKNFKVIVLLPYSLNDSIKTILESNKIYQKSEYSYYSIFTKI